MFTLALLKAGWSAVWGLLSKVPWQVWVALGLALGILLYGHSRHKAGYAKAEAHYLAQFKELERQRDEARARVQKALLEHQQAQEALRLEQEAQLRAADEKRQADLAALRRRLTINVTAENTRSCPDVPRSYLLHRHLAADHANGRSDRAAPSEPAGEPQPESTGVSLSTLAEADTAQADAFRQAVIWGEGWRDYATLLRQSCQKSIAIILEQQHE